MQPTWLVTIPNNKENPTSTFVALQNSLGNLAKFCRFEIPSLTVGTLDSLLGLSDELIKINIQVENVVRKVERQYAEIEGSDGEPLTVNEKSIQAYFKQFEWDFAQYQIQGKPLAELVSQIQSMAGRIDEELKALSNAYTDKNLNLSAVQRKKVINLATSDFEDFLKPEDVAKIDLMNSDSLLSIMVVIPKSMETEFLATFSTLGDSIAAFGGPDWTDSTAVGLNDGNFGKGANRTAVTGSPVVPRSQLKIMEEGESILFAITILRGHYEAGCFDDEVFVPGHFVDYLEPLKVVFREKKFLIREFTYDSSQSGGIGQQLKQAKNDLKAVKQSATRWCKTNYGDVYNGWIHLKVIHGFVESVLRYGLPVNNLAFFVQPEIKLEKEFKSKLLQMIISLRPELRIKKLEQFDEGEVDEDDNLPYVCLKFNTVGTSSMF